MASTSYTSSGSYTHDIDPNAVEVRVYCRGGNGANGSGDSSGAGANGAEAYARFDASDLPSSLDVYVAGDGSGTTGGYNGGGDGGVSGGAEGGGGGGKSEVRPAGAGASNYFAVAGGGGGGGGATSTIDDEDSATSGGAGGRDGEDGGGGDAGGTGGDPNGSGGNGNTNDSDSNHAAGGGGGGGAGPGSGGGASAFTTDATGDGGGGGGSAVDAVALESSYTTGVSATEVVIEEDIAPAAPDNTTQTITGDDEIAVSWDEDTSGGDVGNYRLEVSEDGGAYTAVATPGSSTTSYTYSATQAVDTHQFRVRAENSAGSSDWSETETKSTDIGSVSLTVVDGDQIDLSWDDVDDESGYDILRAEVSGQSRQNYTVAGSVAADETSYSDTGLEDGEAYYYRIDAVYPGTNSLSADEVNGTTDLPAPAIDSLDASIERQLTVNYTLNDDSTDGFVEVAISLDGGSTIEDVVQVGDLTASSYTFDGLLDGREYTALINRATNDTNTVGNSLSAQTILPSPSSLRVLDARDDEADIEFRDNANNKQGYRAHLGPDGFLNLNSADGDHVSVPDSPSLSITGSLSIVFEGTIDTYGDGNPNIVAKDKNSAFRVRFITITGNMWALVDNGSGRDTIETSGSYAAEGETGTWGWTIDFSVPEVRFYKNGTHVESVSTSLSSISDTSGDLLIGSYDGSKEFFDGSMDRLGIFAGDIGDAGHATFAAGDMPDSGDLRAWYDFNQGSGDTLTDYSGNGNDGTLVNSPTWHGGGPVDQQGSDLDPQYALSFDGSQNQYVNMGDVLNLTEPITIGARVELDTLEQEGVVLGAGDPYFLWYDSNSGFRFEMNDGSGYFGDPTIGRSELEADVQYDVIATYDGSVAEIYLDTVNMSSVSTSRNIDIQTSDFLVGAWFDGSRQLTGVVDDPFVANRVISDSEIDDYSDGTVPSNIASHWPFDEGPGSTTANDTVGTNDGTLTNGPEWAAPLDSIRHTLTGLLNGEAYVARASVFTQDAEEYDT